MLHFIIYIQLTILRFRRPFVGLVDGVAEAEVAASASHHVRAWTMEGHLVLTDLLHRCLEALQRTGLLKT